MVLTGLTQTSRTRSTWPLPKAARLAALLLLAACFVVSARTARCAVAAVPGSAATPRPGEVTLPLRDYLELLDAAERADEARKAAARHEPVVAKVVAQHAVVRVSPAASSGAAAGAAVSLTQRLDVLVQGHPEAPLALPLAGVATAVEVLPAGGRAAAAGTGPAGPGLYLVTPDPGRFQVRAESEEQADGDAGVDRVVLPRIVAPVAEMDVELPVSLVWECAGAVAIDDRVEGGRRLLRLSAPTGAEPILVLRPSVSGDQAAELLVQDATATLLELRPEGLLRHDVVLYEVTRGGLADLVVEIPPGLEVERAATDEGAVIPVAEGNRLIVHRQRRLRGSGYLVLSSRPAATGGSISVEPVLPRPAPRARYLAVSTAVPGGFAPRPAASWTRIDLDDLPAELRGALAALDTTAAWRLAAGAAEQGAAVEWAPQPRAAALETVVRRRLTTTLLTVDGTVLHRDSFQLAQAGAALAIDLPAGATLWSTAIDGVPVRPLERNGRLEVPLGASSQVVEVVEVLKHAVDGKRRSLLDLELARVHVPVIEHRWRLLLPERARYRFASGSLQPPRAAGDGPHPEVRWLDDESEDGAGPWSALQGNAAGAPADRVNVGGDLSALSAKAATAAVPAAPGSARLSGRVVDQTGAVLPGATVSLAPPQGPRITQVTDAEGRFACAAPPGTYVLYAELEGFSTTELHDIRLPPGSRKRIEITLNSRIEQTITVTSETPLLDERSFRTGSTISMNDGGGAAAAWSPRNAPPPPAAPSPEVLNELRQGLTGGVRPLPITVPEGGKALLLAGVLPPERITLVLEVKPDRR